MLLICIDFDLTLVNGHFHNVLIELGVPPGNAANHVDGLIKTFGLKNPEKIKELIITALNNGHHIAIVSFSLYPETILPTLERILSPEMTAENIREKIYIRTGFPVAGETSPNCKQEHIADAMKHYGLNPESADDKKRVILMDDSKANFLKALESGHKAILVPNLPNPKPDYINDIILALNDHQSNLEKILEIGKLKTFKENPGQNYLVFKNQDDYQVALNFLQKNYQDKMRISRKPLRIEIKGSLLNDLSSKREKLI